MDISSDHGAKPTAEAERERLEREVQTFESFAHATSLGNANVRRLERYGFVLRPPQASSDGIDLIFTALTHGDEYGGVAVLNTLCSFFKTGVVTSPLSVAFLLCNVEAAREGVRFIQRDMNRSFGRSSTDTLEDRRARAIEPIIRKARYCIDLHQTIEPSDIPFFAFSYQAVTLRFAQAIAPEIPVVTDWGRPFSADGGYRLDELVCRMKGIGVGIELGQKGFGLYPLAAGVRICLEALGVISTLGAEAELPEVDNNRTSLIYTWGSIVPYPSGDVHLEPGLRNFQPIAAGQRLGTVDGAPLLAQRDGLLLFPKYRHRNSEPPPAELYRLLRRPSVDELGRGDCLAPSR